MMVYGMKNKRNETMLDAKLRIFRMAATLCNFTRAAAALGMTQSNVTGQIRRLERELGAELFRRDGRRLELSEAGRVLFREAELLADEEERALRLVRNAVGSVPGFELGATMTAGGFVLPGMIAGFLREHPGRVRLNLRVANTAEISERLKRNFYDLALVEGPFDERFFLSQKLIDDELLLVGRRGCRSCGANARSSGSCSVPESRCCCGSAAPGRGSISNSSAGIWAWSWKGSRRS